MKFLSTPSTDKLNLTATEGTAPMTVTSTTVVPNLNSSLLEGRHASDFASSSHTHGDGDLPSVDEISRKTLTGTSTSAAYFAFAQTPINPMNYSAHFKIIVTSPTAGIGQTMYVWIQGYAENAPIINVFSEQKSTSPSTTGLYYLRCVYPKTGNNGYQTFVELYAYDSTQRDITVEMIDSKNLELLPSLTSSMYNSTYHSYTTRGVNLDGYTTTGTIYGSLSGNATSSTYSTSLYNSSFVAGESLVANDIVYLASDNKWYKASTASRSVPLGTILGRCGSTYSAGSTSGVYLQGYYSLPSGLSGTITLGKDVFVRGSISGSVLTTDGTITTELTSGFSYMRIGSIVNTNAYINYDGNNRVYTVTSSGISHVDGQPIDAVTLGGISSSGFAPSNHVGATGSAHGLATSSTHGFMSSTYASKLDNIASNANNYSLPVATGSVLGGVKQGTGTTINASGVISVSIPTTLPANGGNSDTVDNLHGDDLLKSDVNSEQIISSSVVKVQSTTSTSRFEIDYNESLDSLDFCYYTS